MKENNHSNVGRHNVYGEPLLGIDEAAKRLGISNHTVRAMVRDRKIAFVKLGARVLFRPQDLADLVEFNLVQPQAGPGGAVS